MAGIDAAATTMHEPSVSLEGGLVGVLEERQARMSAVANGGGGAGYDTTTSRYPRVAGIRVLNLIVPVG